MLAMRPGISMNKQQVTTVLFKKWPRKQNVKGKVTGSIQALILFHSFSSLIGIVKFLMRFKGNSITQNNLAWLNAHLNVWNIFLDV